MSSRASGARDGATLLDRLLSLLRQGGVRSLAEVAAELGTSPALVEAMLEDLSRRGYLRPVEAQCARECAGCAQSGRCAVSGAGRVWQMETPGGRS
jgi:predicted ArsR family transcriptional regulator